MDSQKTLDISWVAIFKILLTAVCFYILYFIRDILVWFIFALIISILFNPVIDFLHKKKIPRVLAVALVYVVVFGMLALLIYSVLPMFITEIQQFSQFFPQYFEKISPPLRGLGFRVFEDIGTFIEMLENSLNNMAANILNVLFAIFGGIFATLFVILSAVFLSLEDKAAEKTLVLLFPKKYESFVLNLWARSQKKVAGWFGARLIACIFVGLTSYIVFLVFNVEYPFILALLAGVLNFIPYIGPFFTGILLFLLIFPAEMLKAVFVVVAFFFIQQIEGNILSPILMKKIIGVPPVLVLAALVIGGKLWGILGAILFIPLAGILFEFLKEFLQKRRDRKVVVL